MAERSEPAAGFEAFYRRAWRGAGRWATGLTGSVAAGEDIAQEAFGRLGPMFGSLDNPDGYLRTTIVNLARDERRSAQRRATRELRVVGRDSTTEPPVGREPRLL